MMDTTQECFFASVESIDFSARADAARRYARDFLTDKIEPGVIFGSIGPWQVHEKQDRYVWKLAENISAADQARYRTTVKAIEPKVDGIVRIVLIGESAAASFGYWGKYNLATAVQRCLQQVVPTQPTEVIDLAAVNASWRECNDMLNHALTLEPDAVIFYVGNNEAKGILDYLELGETVVDDLHFDARWSIYGEEQFDSGRKLASALGAHCSRLLKETVDICSAFDVPLLYVLPSANLVDWKPQECVPWAEDSETLRTWCAAVRRAAQRNEPAPSPLNCQAGLWAQGRDLIAKGFAEEGMQVLRSMDVCGLGSFIHGVPQLIDAVGEELAKVCDQLNVACYDMRKSFSPARNALPSKQYFIDYCHLSESGIAVVAPEIAGAVSDLLGLNRVALKTNHFSATPLERFQGSIVGMLHNYHYGQPDENVAHWAREALSSDWPSAVSYLSSLRSVLLLRVRDHLTRRRLEDLQLIRSDWDHRFNLYITKFIYHARFDISLVRIIDSECSKLGFDTRISTPRDPRLSSDGSLYSLYYLDQLNGIRPLARAANRGGWERPELSFVFDYPVASVEFPLIDNPITAIEVTLETFRPSFISVGLNGRHLGVVADRAGVHKYKLQAGACAPVHDAETNFLCFESENLTGMRSLKSPTERYLWSMRYGIYPNSGRLVNLKLCFT